MLLCLLMLVYFIVRLDFFSRQICVDFNWSQGLLDVCTYVFFHTEKCAEKDILRGMLAMAILLQLRGSSSRNNENYPMLQEKTLHIFGAECIHVPEGSLESELEMK